MTTRPSRPRARTRALLVLLAGLGFLVRAAGEAPDASADSRAPVVPPLAEGLVLDGKADEAAWGKAAEVVSERLGGKPVRVRLLSATGALWLAVEAAEDPGFPSGVRMMVATDAAASAADALAFSFGPIDPRAPRFVARGPRGVGRGVYRVDAAADLSRLGGWSAEVRVPLEDLGATDATRPLALALATAGRTPNALAFAPEGAAFQGPATFAKVVPPEGGWRLGAVAGLDAAALLAADGKDSERHAAWAEFVKNQSAAGSVEAVRERLLPPLAKAIAARPDLVTLRWVRGGLLRQLALVEAGAGTGREGPAAKTLEAADADQEAVLAAVPGFREARFALDESLARRWTEPGPTAPSDYDAALARVKAEGERLGERSVAARLAEAVLRYRRGEFAEATALFEPLIAAYPVDEETRDRAKRARAYVEAWGQELGFRKADAAKGDLPRVKIVTTKGDVLVELFEDDAPNSVKNFVFLARSGFYEGTVFHRVIPFFMTQGGGFRSTAAQAVPGAGGPGYAIKTEPSKRKPFRGVIALARTANPDTEGSQFFLTTGTAAHLEGEYSIFGRVLEGQDVVDRLVLGDVVTRVEVLRVRDGVEYRPKGLDQKPVKDPKLPPPPAPPAPPPAQPTPPSSEPKPPK